MVPRPRGWPWGPQAGLRDWPRQALQGLRPRPSLPAGGYPAVRKIFRFLHLPGREHPRSGRARDRADPRQEPHGDPAGRAGQGDFHHAPLQVRPARQHGGAPAGRLRGGVQGDQAPVGLSQEEGLADRWVLSLSLSLLHTIVVSNWVGRYIWGSSYFKIISMENWLISPLSKKHLPF